MGSDSIRVLSGMSRSTGSVYASESVAPGSQLPVKVDTATLRIVIYSDPAYRQEGRYVEAALRALQQYTKRRIEIEETGRPPQRADWLFWVSTQPLPVGAFAHVSRFGPDWNEMVWNGSLPVMMGKLLYGEDTDVVEDRRVIDPVQIVPAHERGTGGEAAAEGGGEPMARGGRDASLSGGSIDLEPAVWWLILLLFIIERVVSHGKRKT